MSDLQTLDGVEIFRTGKWKDREYAEKDLDGMILAFEEFKSSWFRPAIKDGHHTEKGKPALGYVDTLKRIGSKLVAGIVDMPKSVYDAICQHKYDRVSVELIPKLERNGKTYANVLWALSILGVEVPEVDGLKPLRDSLEAGVEVEVFETTIVAAQGDTEDFAFWTAKYINDLPDVVFAVISAGGEKDDEGKTTPRSLRHLPHHGSGAKSGDEHTSVDMPHLRNALARLSQTDLTAAEKSKAQKHLERHAKVLEIGGRKEMGDSEKTIEQYKVEVQALSANVETAKKRIEELSVDPEGGKLRSLLTNLDDTQQKFQSATLEFEKSKKRIAELEDQNRKEKTRQKVGKLRVPALRFFAEQFYDWATKEGDRIITFTQDGVKKEKLAEQIVDEFCGVINKATENLLIQHSKINAFKRDDTPGDDNPRVEVDNRVRAYMAEHPEVAYDKAMEQVLALDSALKTAYARS